MMWVAGAGRGRGELGKAETLAVWDSGTLGGVARRRGTEDGGGGRAGMEDGRDSTQDAACRVPHLLGVLRWALGDWQETREGAAR